MPHVCWFNYLPIALDFFKLLIVVACIISVIILNLKKKTFLSNTSSQIVGILAFISMINTKPESLKARKVCHFQHFRFYKQLKFHAQLS